MIIYNFVDSLVLTLDPDLAQLGTSGLFTRSLLFFFNSQGTKNYLGFNKNVSTLALILGFMLISHSQPASTSVKGFVVNRYVIVVSSFGGGLM